MYLAHQGCLEFQTQVERTTINTQPSLNSVLHSLQQTDALPEALAARRIGLEKESLRIDPRGRIAQTLHPKSLGSPLTHGEITTDYSEALLELITPPMATPKAVLEHLHLLHKFVIDKLSAQGELTWSSSMPCVLDGEESIRIAEYGSSNAGQMKTIYRRGLGLRYGRLMQVIAGVHFNFSLSDDFWRILQGAEGSAREFKDFRSDRYFRQLRNLQRDGWLVPYLFGASPAVCESFFGVNEPIGLEYFGHHTYYQSYATSLRMGDIGYQNKKEGRTGVHIVYDDVDAYVAGLERAISTPCPVYESMGVVRDGEYQQLNANMLQIENEYYSSVRPKAILRGMEKPVRALQRAGVEYVELRSVDVNPFDPAGVNEMQLRFLEAFMIFNALRPTDSICDEEAEINDANASRVAHRGREPGLTLRRGKGEVPLYQWGTDILEAMQPVCEMLDQAGSGREYVTALEEQMSKLDNPDLTPSAQVLREMTENGESFYEFSLRQAQQHQRYYRALAVSDEMIHKLELEAEQTHRRQTDIEASDSVTLETFLEEYFAQ